VNNSILIDANVLVYALDDRAPQHSACLGVIQRSATGELPGLLVPQVLIECFAIVTSPRRVAHPIQEDTAREVLQSLSEAIEVKPVPETLLEDLLALLARHPRRGQDVFDLALVAQMVNHGIRTICTCNTADFEVRGIRAVEPGQLLAVYA
jgi:predicted nucleic acid-binding protein